jgi:hypothetical protein
MAANAASVSPASIRRRRVSAAGYGYAAAALAVVLGWIVTRERQLFDPLEGFGYWLGITGASLMAVLLLYPVRKRVRLLRVLGATRYWFRMHMLFGVVGPILILYHCNFKLGSLNSNVALFCTLLVAGSGLIGRYLHAKIFADLEGHRRSLQQMTERAQLTPEQTTRAARIAPDLLERMRRFDARVMAPPQGLLACLILPATLALTTRLGYLRLVWHAQREIRREAKEARVSRRQRRKVERAVADMIGGSGGWPSFIHGNGCSRCGMCFICRSFSSW